MRIIDTAANQSCTTDPAVPQPERSINLSVAGPAGPAGPPGPTGPAGSNGAPGATGGEGSSPPATTIAPGRTLTLAGGQVITVGGVPSVTLVAPVVKPSTARDVTLTVGSGPTAFTSSILSYGFLVANSTPGSSARAHQLHDISITKKIDQASPKLYLACATGKHFPKAVITVRRAGELVVKYTLKDVAVVAVQSDGAARGVPDEAITLNFASQQFDYK